MFNHHTYSVHLPQFEGGLDLLLQLVQKKEIFLNQVRLSEIMEAFLQKLKGENLFDQGSEFILLGATLTLLKSRELLPKEESLLALEEIEDPRFEIIHHLIDYCRFKEAATLLTEIEQKQEGHFPRGVEDNETKKPLGLNQVTIGELATLFNEVLAKAKSYSGVIEGEVFLIEDKIRLLYEMLQAQEKIPFLELFKSELVKEELIVIFLAVLEMLKRGDLKVTKDKDTVYAQRN